MTVYMTIDLTKDFETYFDGRRIWRKSKLTLQSFLTQFCLTKADQNISIALSAFNTELTLFMYHGKLSYVYVYISKHIF